ncbi:MAG: tripartite tricarboxylate transporter substrate binding protein [Alphaproteobacteria bacterium]|nr:tripartite tricarboxylate transporter substrate binding protein [Alphaproteobacteria bacterium]
MHNNISSRRALLAATLATPFLSQTGQAQGSEWPNRPVRVVVPWPPGGGADTTARMIFPKLAQKLGQPFVIENRPGASGSIGAAEVARAAPDGYTILHDATPLAINPFLIRVSFDALADLKAVFLPMQVPMLLVMHPSQARRSLADVIALAKSRPGSLDWASSGNGSAQHLALELFTRAAGITVNHVPYRGGGPALTDVVAGQVGYFFSNSNVSLPFVQGGRVRAVAHTGRGRIAAFPDLSAIGDSLPGYEAYEWNCILAPARTPAAIIEKLNTALNEVVQDAEVAARYTQLAMVVQPNSSAQAEAFLRSETEKFGRVIREANIKLE